ncbi:TetR/AcrR family transcriptional regulator [Granulicella sp. dw_53]|uniref:TetR/AcrR family transcriptional regulator n=1 Tax=Granulicella sp. dw_53 TaxID=2719792 RepID=UPI001BD24A55|nr:TetR/AcrR family transcriptional regulator [Granulicella sp. dw_53]
MRKSRKTTAETRQRIIETASEEFRRNGIEKTGLSELMAAAGLTHGGFYKHFESKEQLAEESVAFSIDSMIESWRRTLSNARPKRGLQTAVKEYLSTNLRDDVASGCPFAALCSEMARDDQSVRETSTTGFLKMVDLIAGQLGGMSRPAAQKEALWMFSSMIGAVVMARVVTDPEISDSILREARKHLLRPSKDIR